MLSEEQRRQIITALSEGKAIPQELQSLLFHDPAKEFELVYRNKLSEEAILANRDGALPAALQIDRVYAPDGEVELESWKNLIVFGDNLSFLKSVYKNQHPLIKDRIKGRVKLIYIDPPFATGERYDANKGQRAYSARRVGSDFIEFLRRRLILAREILAEDGVMVVRNAYNYGHYVKIILDEIFSIDRFINEIIINRKRKSMGSLKKYEVAYEYLYVYSRSDHYFFENQLAKKPLSRIKWTSFLSQEERNPRERRVLGLTFLPPAGQHFSLNQAKTEQLLKEHYLRVKHKPSGAIFYYSQSGNDDAFYKTISTKGVNKFKYQDITTQTEVFGVREIREIPRFKTAPVEEFKIEYLTRDEEKITNDWRDIPSYTDTSGYPTENSEQLLARVIRSFTKEGDLIMDFFAGSGTTAVVAEKLNRQWIAVDMGKLSYFTMQKRLLQIYDSKDAQNRNKKFGRKARSFLTCRALSPLPDNRLKLDPQVYRQFVSTVFNITLQPFQWNGIEFDGRLDDSPALIFDDTKSAGQSIDIPYLRDLSKRLHPNSPAAIYIIVPELYLEMDFDSFHSDGITFYFFKIPDQILTQLGAFPSQNGQPNQNRKKNHDFEEAIGFHLNLPPQVKSEIESEGTARRLFIKSFKSRGRHAQKKQVWYGLGTLSGVFIDRDYNGRWFTFDLTFFAEELFPFLKTAGKNREEINKRFAELNNGGLRIELGDIPSGKTIGIIYTDIHGNFFREQFTL
ncbi:DNA methyltransferase [Calditrichota bacterium GD2]